jgi:hypothetical protein
MQNNTIGGAGGILIGYGLSAVQTNMVSGLVLVGLGVLLVILVAVLQKEGINVQSNIQG